MPPFLRGLVRVDQLLPTRTIQAVLDGSSDLAPEEVQALDREKTLLDDVLTWYGRGSVHSPQEYGRAISADRQALSMDLRAYREVLRALFLILEALDLKQDRRVHQNLLSACLRMTVDLSDGMGTSPDLIARMAGMEGRVLFLRHVNRHLARKAFSLSLEDASVLDADLAALEVASPPFSKCLLSERDFFVAQLEAVARGTTSHARVGPLIRLHVDRERAHWDRCIALTRGQATCRRVERALADAVDARISEVAWLSTDGQRSASADGIQQPGILAWLRELPSNVLRIDSVYRRDAESFAWARGLRVVIAVLRHRAVHRTLPGALDEVPGRTRGPLPADPIAGAPFRYRKDGRSFSLYSPGFDGRDDGGLPALPGRQGDVLIWPHLESNEPTGPTTR